MVLTHGDISTNKFSYSVFLSIVMAVSDEEGGSVGGGVGVAGAGLF